ncbi:MAG: D-alanyl-D-alanine carboxypeptidase/D-alanyl-D-alanine-endopeptidase [Bacteroides sp.]|jgi:D-alanyl-D-alanine carboxypeptidase/D-alanyl-D-alanine-endopeptidase (penicillin-binding protein 4)|nr:D-alanyl-D-alanine carboxypeptidase/D-alanyl-D-alanine-endopeptidase [Bacteroides sp.]
MKKRKPLLVIIFFAAFLLSFTSSETSGPVSSLENAIIEFSKDPALARASWGICVMDVSNGRVLGSHNADMALVPASTQKVLTTASALLMLGPEFRYKTTLGYTGRIDSEGTLHGDLVIKGSGDPSFGSTNLHDSLNLDRVFLQWLENIRRAGIKKITGSIVADASIFDDEMIPRKWIWEDMGNYYGAGASGLTANENLYTVYFKPAQAEGLPAKVLFTEPPVPGMELINQVTTGKRGSGDQVYIFGAPYQMQRTLTGTVPLGSNNFPVKGSIPDPPLFVAASFSDFLTKINITQGKPAISHRELSTENIRITEPFRLLSIWKSPPLFSLAGHTNLNSVNTYAENLLKTLGSIIKGEGSTEAGVEAIKEYWNGRGLDTRGMFLYDGSGLSPSNRITVRQLAMVLQETAGSQSARFFIAGLPLAGRTGSIAGSFRGTPSENVLRAKSGYLANVRSYAGMTRTREGKTLAFAIIVNHYEGTPASMREKLTGLMDAITRYNQ